MKIRDIKNPIIFVALKRVCQYIVDDVWDTDIGGDDETEAEFELAKVKSKKYQSDILKLSKLDTDLNWGDKKVIIDEKRWATHNAGDYNPWYHYDISLEDLLSSIEPVADFVNAGDNYIQDSEFLHYYDFLASYLNVEKKKSNFLFWDNIHKDVRRVAESSFRNRDFANSVRVSLVEIEDRVRMICKEKTGKEYSGDDLMHHAFSPKSPIIELDDIESKNGLNIQSGYMQIFAGTMVGIRNPKSHKNFEIDETRAIHFLFLASLLMTILDEAADKKGTIY